MDQGGYEGQVLVYQNQKSMSTTIGLLGTGNEPSIKQNAGT